jgi:hypothetical protein
VKVRRITFQGQSGQKVLETLPQPRKAQCSDMHLPSQLLQKAKYKDHVLHGHRKKPLNENNFNPRILYPTKLSFKIDRGIKIFDDKQKLKQYVTSKTSLQKIL